MFKPPRGDVIGSRYVGQLRQNLRKDRAQTEGDLGLGLEIRVAILEAAEAGEIADLQFIDIGGQRVEIVGARVILIQGREQARRRRAHGPY